MLPDLASQKIDALSPKRARFVREYLIDLNATQAAVRAGYSERSAKTQGARLLTDADIADAVAEAQNARATRTEITSDRVLEGVAKLAFFDILDLLNSDGSLKPLDEIAPEARTALHHLEIAELDLGEDAPRGQLKKIKLTDRLAALTLLMRHLGMLNDKVKLQGDAENPLSMLLKEIQGSALKPVRLPASVAMTGDAE